MQVLQRGPERAQRVHEVDHVELSVADGQIREVREGRWSVNEDRKQADRHVDPRKAQLRDGGELSSVIDCALCVVPWQIDDVCVDGIDARELHECQNCQDTEAAAVLLERAGEFSKRLKAQRGPDGVRARRMIELFDAGAEV